MCVCVCVCVCVCACVRACVHARARVCVYSCIHAVSVSGSGIELMYTERRHMPCFQDFVSKSQENMLFFWFSSGDDKDTVMASIHHNFARKQMGTLKSARNQKFAMHAVH